MSKKYNPGSDFPVDGALQLTKHARERLKSRNISLEEVYKPSTVGNTSTTIIKNKAGRKVITAYRKEKKPARVAKFKGVGGYL